MKKIVKSRVYANIKLTKIKKHMVECHDSEICVKGNAHCTINNR